MSIFTTLPDGSVQINYSTVFYVGDPCYCFSHKTQTWDGLCSSWFSLNGGPIAKTDDVEVVGFSTAHGDGNYLGQVDCTNYYFPVDAGLLGVVPQEFIEPDSTFAKDSSCGILIELSAGDIIQSINGDFFISGSRSISIETNFSNEEDEEDDEYDNDRDYSYNDDDEEDY